MGITGENRISSILPLQTFQRLTDLMTDRELTENKDGTEERSGFSRLSRPFLLVFGWLMVGLGAVGIFVPGLPTVPFLLLALWAFARSSQRFHDWLYTHPRLGPPLQDWKRGGVIPSRAKWLAILMMSISVIVLYVTVENPLWSLVLAVGLLPIAAFIMTRPGHLPDPGSSGKMDS